MTDLNYITPKVNKIQLLDYKIMYVILLWFVLPVVLKFRLFGG